MIQGTFVIGMGTSGKRETAVEMPTGSFILIPALRSTTSSRRA